jgi:hypothetical protein
MKSPRQIQLSAVRWHWAALLGLCAAAGTLAAADTNTPPPLTPEQRFEGGTNTYTNWIEFGGGGAVVSGDKAQFQQQHQVPAGAFGGISDFHYQTGIASNTTLTLDGRGIVDNHDYKLSLAVQRENTGYLRLGYEQERTWFDGGGGYYPPASLYYQSPNSMLGVDRSKLTLEAGWTPEKGPKVIFKYAHSTRDGTEPSTEWGFAHPPGQIAAQGLNPTQDVIHEHNDSFQLDVTDHIKATEFGGGLRYETGKLNDALLITQYPGEPVQQKITDSQGTLYDVFDVHGFAETKFRSNMLFSCGAAYSRVGENFDASRIYGNDFDVGYTPNAANSFGYYGLGGQAEMNEYVFDFNLFYKPAPHWTIVPSLRADRDDWTASSAGWETLGANAPAPFSSDSKEGLTDLRQRLDVTYNGLTNWVLYGRGELTEINGSLNQDGGLVPVGGIGIVPIEQYTSDRRFFQKYSAGVRWYPTRGVSLDAGGYYKYDQYHYDNSPDNPSTGTASLYPGFLAMQDFETYDGNVRLTLRPWRKVSAVSRYEYQYSTIHTEPDAQYDLPNVESSRMITHIIAQDIGWTPWSRLSLQSGVNVVRSDTRTPASDVVAGILNSQNNYWTANFSSLLALDNKTDLNLSYLYYASADYNNNSPVGVPYGAGSREQAVTATLTRRISQNMRLTVKYGYFRYHDTAFGSNQDFGANVIYASVRYRF